MGTNIDREAFDEVDDARFQQRLEQCLSTLGELLERPGFGVGPATIGAELELFLVDEMARPLPHNQAVRAAAADARVNVELDRFNLELNATPTLLAGRPFAALGEELRLLLGRVADAAGKHGGRPVLVGILPTLRRADLNARVISDLPRYRALNRRLRLLRHDPFHLRIAGADPLELASDDVALEGAAASFQVHLRVDPDEFTRTYNAVQAATAPVLAVAGNSPTLLGHHDPLAGMEEGQAPPLQELRLHQGTVWRWNRAVYDPASGGHLRIEMRALPSGPTVTDMLANAALLVGLSLWLAEQDPSWTYALSFERAEHGFYRAAQQGLAAELTWPLGHGGRLDTRRAAELVPELLPAAWDGLVRAGVAAAEADRLLGVIAARVA